MNSFDRTVNDTIEMAARLMAILFRLLALIRRYVWIIFIILFVLAVSFPDFLDTVLTFFSNFR